MAKSEIPEFFSKQVSQAKRFFIESQTAKNATIKVVCGGFEHTASDFKIDRKDFPYYSIEFVASGQGKTVLNNEYFDIYTGSIFSYGPGISQLITNTHGNTMDKYFIDFVGTDAKKWLKIYTGGIGTCLKTSRPDEIKIILDDIIKHGQSDSPYKSMLCSTLLEYLFIRIAETKITEKTNVFRALATYQNCRRYIKDNYIKLNTLQEISDSCIIDKAYLCRLFKRFDTQSPYQYLINLKMAHAADKLRESNALVKQVAHELGFNDPFHFTRTFKKVFGISPQSFKGIR